MNIFDNKLALDVDKLNSEIAEAMEKVAYGHIVASPSGPGRCCWTDKFKGTPLFAQAVALEEEDLALEMKDLQRRMEERQRETSMDMWTARDMVRLKKQRLELELSKAENAEVAADQTLAETATEPAVPPGAPAALATSTPSSEKVSAIPIPGFAKGLATRLGGKIMGSDRYLDMGETSRKVLDGAQRLGHRLGGQTNEQALGRGLLAVGGAGAATLGGGAMLLGGSKQPSVNINMKTAEEKSTGVSVREAIKSNKEKTAGMQQRHRSGYSFDDEGRMVSHYSTENIDPDVDTLRLAQQHWSSLSPAEKQKVFSHLPAHGALLGGALGAGGAALIPLALGTRSRGALLGSAALGALGGGLLGHRSGKKTQEAMGSARRAPKTMAYDLSRQQIANDYSDRIDDAGGTDKTAVSVKWIKNTIHKASKGRRTPLPRFADSAEKHWNVMRESSRNAWANEFNGKHLKVLSPEQVAKRDAAHSAALRVADKADMAAMKIMAKISSTAEIEKLANLAMLAKGIARKAMPVSAIQQTTPSGMAAVRQGMAAKAQKAIPVPTAGAAGDVFAQATPKASPFAGTGTAVKAHAPAAPLPPGSMQSPQFLERYAPGVTRSFAAIDDIARMPAAQSQALASRVRLGPDVAAHRAHLINQQGVKLSALLRAAKARQAA